VLLVAAAARLATLTTWSVWIDEAFTLHDARHDPPPYALAYALTGAIVAVLGDGEAALRALPCAAGLATVALLLFTRPADGAPRATPLVAGAILAVLPWHQFMSQNARHYALQAGAVLLAFLAADGRLGRGGRARPLTAAVALAVALACHPSAVFFAPGLLLVVLRRTRARARGAALATGALAAVTAVAIAVYLPLQPGYLAAKGSGSTLQLVASYGFLAGPALLLAAGAAAFARPRPAAELLFVGSTAGVFALASCVWFATGYHAFASVPVVVLLAARGVLTATRVRGVLAALLVAGIAAGSWLYHTQHGMRPRYREAAAWLAAARDDGCRLFATQPGPVAYHLGERRELRAPAAVTALQPWTLGELERALRAGPVAVLLHADELQRLAAPERTALDELLRALPEERVFSASFGPKDLTLVARRTR
jgi:hypothetical protein